MATPPSEDARTFSSAASRPPLPTKSISLTSPASGAFTQGTKRTERPVEPTHIYHAFDKSREEELTIGNPKLQLDWVMDGHIGFFMDRDKTTHYPTEILMDTTVFYDVVQTLITGALWRLFHLKGKTNVPGLQMTIESAAPQLTNGVLLSVFLKLQNVNHLVPNQLIRFRKRPKVPTDFTIPMPFALLISHLGRVKISGIDQELIVTPTVSDESASRFCLPIGQQWTPSIYGQAVEFAKLLGMQFKTVDLNVKTGSTWWLYTPEFANNMFRLTCPMPEENFTPATAVIRTMLCVDLGNGLANNIFDLTPLGTLRYGSMCRNPSLDIALSTFFAIDDVNETVWKLS